MDTITAGQLTPGRRILTEHSGWRTVAVIRPFTDGRDGKPGVEIDYAPAVEGAPVLTQLYSTDEYVYAYPVEETQR